MLDLMRDGERSVGELIATMRLQRPVASHHLGALIQAGLVRQRRRGRSLVCVVDPRPLSQAFGWIDSHLSRGRRQPVA
jgi:DNA-binding transcriptional ArsR family regulator